VTPEPPVEFTRICHANGLPIDESHIRRLQILVDGLLEWNAKINVISRRDHGNPWYVHLLHCIAPLFYFEIPHNAAVLDLGSGGGLPGLPLAIVRPDLRLVLVDSIGKKTAVIENLIERIGLSGITVVTARAEALARDSRTAKQFDIVVARAVAPLVELIRWSSPLLKHREPSCSPEMTSKRRMLNTGSLLALKGGNLNVEIEEAQRSFRSVAITVINMTFTGSLEIGLEDKKMAAVEFH